MNEESTKFCKFYKGDDVSVPTDETSHLLVVERDWCQLQETDQGKSELGSMLDEYMAYGLREFENMDGVPMTLKAILFNRFSHWNRPDTEEFKNWYLETYRK